jgi:hypothetical protein
MPTYATLTQVEIIGQCLWVSEDLQFIRARIGGRQLLPNRVRSKYFAFVSMLDLLR